LKVGNLVKRRDPSWDTQNQLGLVIDLETVKQVRRNTYEVAKVQWLGGEYPPFMYRAESLILVSEEK
jgi:hypothetical protein